MDPDQPKDPRGQFDASLPLPPGRGGHSDVHKIPPADAPEAPKSAIHSDSEAAADLIRKKIEAAYGAEPSAVSEVEDVAIIKPTAHLSKHQQYIRKLISSGKSMADIQTGWHDYYDGLSDSEKHEVWQEFYDMQAKARATPPEIPKPTPVIENRPPTKTYAQLHKKVHGQARELPGKRHFQSLIFGLAAGAIAVLIVLFSFFNERFIAPFIQPSRSVTNTPLISDASAVGSAPEIIIPKINVEIPVVYGVNTIDESAVETALEDGVVHYADTALPGQNGNGVIVGHSSNNIFNKGKYKFAFVLLSRLETGDVFYLQKDGKRYTYQVYSKEVVNPDNVGVLGPKDKPATFTLITCDPPGTSINRLVVIGEQISPDPAGNSAATSQNSLATQAKKVPGNSQSLWSRLTHWFSE